MYIYTCADTTYTFYIDTLMRGEVQRRWGCCVVSGRMHASYLAHFTRSRGRAFGGGWRCQLSKGNTDKATRAKHVGIGCIVTPEAPVLETPTEACVLEAHKANLSSLSVSPWFGAGPKAKSRKVFDTRWTG